MSYGRHFLYLQLLLNFNLSVKYLKVCVLTITNNKNLTYVKEHENAEVVQPALMIVPRQKINQRSKSYRLLISRQLLSGSKIEMIIKARFVFFSKKKSSLQILYSEQIYSEYRLSIVNHNYRNTFSKEKLKLKKQIQKNPDYHKDGTREFKSVQSMFGPQERSLSTCDDPNVSKSDEKFKKPYIY